MLIKDYYQEIVAAINQFIDTGLILGGHLGAGVNFLNFWIIPNKFGTPSLCRDILGQCLTLTLTNETVSTGHYMIYWDERNDEGEKVKLILLR